MGMERDDDSDEIVRALEKSLPRWEGYEDVGWMSEVSHVSITVVTLVSVTNLGDRNAMLRLYMLSRAIKTSCTRVLGVGVQRQMLTVCFSGNRLATALESVGEETVVNNTSYTVCSL